MDEGEEERKKSLETHYESVVNEMTKYHEGSMKNVVESGGPQVKLSSDT